MPKPETLGSEEFRATGFEIGIDSPMNRFKNTAGRRRGCATDFLAAERAAEAA